MTQEQIQIDQVAGLQAALDALAAVPGVEFVTAGSGDASVAVPEGALEVGDVVLMVARGGFALTLPAGFTTVDSGTGNGANYYAWGWKRVVASDITPGTWSVTGGGPMAYAIYRGAANPEFGATTKITTLSVFNVTFPAVSGLADGDRVIRLFGTAANGDPTPTFTAADGVQRASQRADNYWAVGIGDQAVGEDGAVDSASASWPSFSDYAYTSVTLRPGDGAVDTQGIELLAVTSYGLPADASTTAFSYSKINAANLKITFEAPVSGKVMIRVFAFVTNSGGVNIGVGQTGAVEQAKVAVVGTNEAARPVELPFIISGLTPGQEYTYWAWFAVGQSGTAVIQDAGYGTCIMEVWALQS